MDNQRPLTPEGFRTAAYLAARERMDAGKTRKNVHCNPPNVRCGNRCIPPTWDCRLTGQGNDPHLRAVKTDPLGGLANIQRGIGRLAKGLVKGNFSEVEGGKRALIRGTVKITPGNMHDKKELQRNLEERTRTIGIALAVLTGGLGVHAILMRSNTFGYRDGVGANINNAARAGVSKILDATPIIGANRARVRRQVQLGIEGQLRRQSTTVSSTLSEQLSRTRVSSSDAEAHSNLVKALSKVNAEHTGGASTFYDWDKAHQRAFWTTKKIEKGVGLKEGEKGNIFARPATNEFLVRQFKLQGDDTLTTEAIKDGITRNFTQYKNDLLSLAQQQGFTVRNTREGGRSLAHEDRRPFIQGLVSSTLPASQSSMGVRAALTSHLEQILSRSPRGVTNEIYTTTYTGFNTFYNSQTRVIENVANLSRMTPEMRRTGAEQIMIDGRQARAQYVLGLTQPGKQIRGAAHAELVLRDYHARNILKTPRRLYEVSDRLATAAATELVGHPVGRAEAFQVLEREGFSGAVPRNRLTVPRGRRLTEGEAVYQLMRENPGMSRTAAIREVRRRRGEETSGSPQPQDSPAPTNTRPPRRERGDAHPEMGTVRAATYLSMRQDFTPTGKRKGKPCGKSFVKRSAKCSKPTVTHYAEESTGEDKRNIVSTVGKVALTAGAVAGTALAFKHRRTLITGAKIAKNTVNAERNLYLKIKKQKLEQKNSYGGAKYSPQAAARAARTEYVQSRRESIRAVTPHVANRIVTELSADQVRVGIAKLPKDFQEPAKNLVGHAKRIAAGMGLKAEGFSVVNVNNKHNFATYKKADGQVASVGSIGDSIVIYNSEFKGKLRGVDYYGMAFTVDRRFDQKRTITQAEGQKIKEATKEMFKDNIDNLPDNAFVFNTPYKDDGKGRGREAAYKRQGFRVMPRSDRMWAIKDQGKFRKLSDQEMEVLTKLWNERGDAIDDLKPPKAA